MAAPVSRYRLELELELPDDKAATELGSAIFTFAPARKTGARLQVWREAERPWLTSVLVFAWGRATERRQRAGA